MSMFQVNEIKVRVISSSTIEFHRDFNILQNRNRSLSPGGGKEEL